MGSHDGKLPGSTAAIAADAASRKNGEPEGGHPGQDPRMNAAFGNSPPEVRPADDPFYQTRTERLETFHTHIENMRRDGLFPKGHEFIEEFDRGVEEIQEEPVPNIPWAECPEARKLEDIVEAALSWYIPGTYALSVIEELVDVEGLAPWQRTMLADVRSKVDAGQLDCRHPEERLDTTWDALHDIVAINKFDRELAYFKREGIYFPFPDRRPWESLREDEQAGTLASMGGYFGAPGHMPSRSSSVRSMPGNCPCGGAGSSKCCERKLTTEGMMDTFRGGSRIGRCWH